MATHEPSPVAYLAAILATEKGAPTPYRAARDAAEILADYGATVESVAGDPRGYCLKLRLASGRSNSMGSGIWGV